MIVINIHEKMTELIEDLSTRGINGITFCDIYLEHADEMNGVNYAIAGDAYTPDLFMCNDEYFDHGRLLRDFKQYFVNAFKDDSTVVVEFHDLDHGSNEVEVYREDKTSNR